jgi:ribonuclease P protein component
MTSIKIHSLGKQERLKSRKQIDALFEAGKKMMVFPFRMIYQEHSVGFPLQAGFTVSARNFPRAVDRNRIKRLSREAYRLKKLPLETLLKKNHRQFQLFFIYTGKEIPDFQQVDKTIGTLLDKFTQQL